MRVGCAVQKPAPDLQRIGMGVGMGVGMGLTQMGNDPKECWVQCNGSPVSTTQQREHCHPHDATLRVYRPACKPASA